MRISIRVEVDLPHYDIPSVEISDEVNIELTMGTTANHIRQAILEKFDILANEFCTLYGTRAAVTRE